MDDRLRTIGAVTAAGLSGLVAIAALAIGRLGVVSATFGHLELLAMGAGLGVPVGAVLGFRNAPRIARQSAAGAFQSTLAVAGRAVVLGDLVVSVVWVVTAAFAAAGGSNSGMDPAALLAAMVALPIIGLLFLGLPAFVLAFAVVWPWTFVIRRLARDAAPTDDAVPAEPCLAGRPVR
jgi:hypothetical protein